MQDELEPDYAGEPEVAIIGMSGRFPGADDMAAFWKNLREGVDSISFFSREELLDVGVPEDHLDDPDYVRAFGALRDVAEFDAAFFGYSPREAETMEPAHRLFLETAWEAVESAGYDPGRVDGRVGVFAGVGSDSYTRDHIRANDELAEQVGEFQITVGSGKDFLATRVSYKMDLRGPAVTVQTGCSTALVAVHMACQSLLNGESDFALAGGASVPVPQKSGYKYESGSILSRDGRTRAFDAESSGTNAGSGVGVIALKRLEDALADGDPVLAVIKGSAINNDGSNKVAYTAPSPQGQADVIAEALAAADVDAATISYVEGHGSGTELGDPIEVAALNQAFAAAGLPSGSVLLGSVKTNVGHLDTAAGVAGLAKTVLALRAGEIPPTAHFRTPNPRIPFDRGPFRVSGELERWERTDGEPRRAGVSSFGIGGTNAHVVLEEAPEAEPSGPSRPAQLLVVSALGATALDQATDRLAAHLREHPELPLADTAYTLALGRRAFSHRRAVVVREGEDVASVLEARTPDRVATGVAEGGHRSVAFMFPGLGDHYVNMARGLYEAEPVFREEVDRCCDILRPHLGLDLREVLFPGDAPREDAPGAKLDLRRMLKGEEEADPAKEKLDRTEVAQPAVFVVEWALAKLWSSLGVEPEAVIGHSLGEYTAAAVAGVWSLEDALALVAERAKMIQALPGGSMLAVSASPDAVRESLVDGVSLATVNAPELCVVSGSDEGVAKVEEALQERGIVARRLSTTHAFHSAMMEPIVERFSERVARTTMSAPSIPFVSNVTGTWITADQATDPDYWARHLRATVRWSDGVATLLEEPDRVLLEVGPGQTLSTFVRQRPRAEGEAEAPIVPSIRYPYDRTSDRAFLLGAVGRLWLAGVEPEWTALWADERRHRVPLPTYPWQRQRYWVEAPDEDETPARKRGKLSDPAEWLYLPSWRRVATAEAGDLAASGQILVFAGDDDVSRAAVSALRAAGAEVMVVRAGEKFDRVGDGEYVLRPAARDDYDDLAAALEDAAERPDRVLHLWSLGADALDQDRGYVSLAFVADALGRRDDESTLRVVAVGRGMCDVTGAEPLEPARATLLAVCRAIPQEHARMRCRAVDVVAPEDGPEDAESLAGRLLAELADDGDEPSVALRGRRRWVRGWDEVRPRPSGAEIREGGVYLLTGSLDGRGEQVARHLWEAHRARLVLFDSGVPERGKWENVLSARSEEDPTRRRIETIQALEAEGAEVLVLKANLTRREDVERALARVDERFGALHGVVHAASLTEVGDFGGVGDTHPGEWAPFVRRLLAELEALDGALEGRDLDWVLVESSLASALGGVGVVRIAAANLVTDLWVERRDRTASQAWTSVAWDQWAAEGEGGEFAVTPAEAPKALEHVLSLAGEPHVLVSTGDLETRVREGASSLKALASASAARSAGIYARPELATEYHAPTSELEEQIAEMWQQLLGIDRIGIHDDFFGLGGHSLLATQIVSRVREIFHLEIPLKAIFEAPTVARFSVLLEEAIIAEIEELTDEEAAAFL